MRRLLAVSLIGVLAMTACSSDAPPEPSGFVTDDQVKASDATSTTTAGSGGSSTTAPAELTFCGAWAASRALEEGSTGGQPDFERMQRSIVAVRDTAPATLHDELDDLLADLDRLRVIGQRYSWRFDESAKVSDEDAAAIDEITDAISAFGTDSKVARAAAKDC